MSFLFAQNPHYQFHITFPHLNYNDERTKWTAFEEMVKSYEQQFRASLADPTLTISTLLPGCIKISFQSHQPLTVMSTLAARNMNITVPKRENPEPTSLCVLCDNVPYEFEEREALEYFTTHQRQESKRRLQQQQQLQFLAQQPSDVQPRLLPAAPVTTPAAPTEEAISKLMGHVLSIAELYTKRAHKHRCVLDDEEQWMGEIDWYADAHHTDWMMFLVTLENICVVHCTPGCDFVVSWSDPNFAVRLIKAFETLST